MASNDSFHMYIYNLPFADRKTLCSILDVNNRWQDLGGIHMKYDLTVLRRIETAIYRGQSPSDELLTFWGTQNHTVLELFVLLSKMHHYQAMTVLKPLVDPKYHLLIYEGKENITQVINKDRLSTKEPHESSVPSNSSKPEKKFINNLSRQDNNNADCTKKEWNQINEMGFRKCNIRSKIGFADGVTPIISYSELEQATKGWSKKQVLGKGGFGTVYEGFWKNTNVAIKRLEAQKGHLEGDQWKSHREQSLRELKYLNSYRHDNILALYGYSFGGPHDCLVYQFMPNGSLEDRLLCKEGSRPLSWLQRHSIAKGTARGLQFLHTIGDKPLIHGDIKSANILLDPYLEPKIGDFGLAREGPLQHYTHVKLSTVHGTRPYLPDEFLRGKKFSTKVDTYSFGIVLFELATGLRAHDEYRRHKFLRDHVLAVQQERVDEMLRDSRAGPGESYIFEAFLRLGKQCIATSSKERPEMVIVLQPLESSKATADLLPQNMNKNNSFIPDVSPHSEEQPKNDHGILHRTTNQNPNNVHNGQNTSDRDISEHPSLGKGSPIICALASPENTCEKNNEGTVNDLPLISELGIKCTIQEN